MKTCKYGCGGKMKEGGKVATMKKMKVGGAKPCGPMLCPDGNGSCINCPSGKKAGVIITAIASGMANALGGKKRQANEAAKKAAEEAANTPVAKFTKKLDETLKTKKRGGTVKKKYAMGGAANKANIPLITNNPRADQGRILKAGGAVNKKFAALAPPYNKATFADRIAGAKKKAGKK
jgi:hypothetical protein